MIDQEAGRAWLKNESKADKQRRHRLRNYSAWIEKNWHKTKSQSTSSEYYTLQRVAEKEAP